ncbi:MAG: sortase [Candidatus Doudnabacteria bacterium]|nr:sortase [Candidatus Doudnabacteria bacterium]
MPRKPSKLILAGSWLWRKIKPHTPKLFYPVVFIVAFAFFYTLFNFSSLVSQVDAVFNNQSQDEVILGEDIGDYYEWISRYYFAVSDKKLLSATNDIDEDGLANYDEFVLQTNPTVLDSDNDGVSDGLEVINQTNPWGQGSMTQDQLKSSEPLDLIMINNRISFNIANHQSNASNNPKIDYDLEKHGTLSIPKLNLQVPIVWTKDPASFSEDLKNGVVHYPGTALPGEPGVVYIAGHSSDYIWNNHPYTRVFAKLNFLEPGDDVFVDVTGADGQIRNFRYVVTEENVYNPDDQAQFIDDSTAKLNLSTCWPIGTQRDRYVVSAVLEGI